MSSTLMDTSRRNHVFLLFLSLWPGQSNYLPKLIAVVSDQETKTRGCTFRRCTLVQSRGGICTPVHTVCSRFGQGKEASAIVPSSSSRCCLNRVDGEQVWQPNEEPIVADWLDILVAQPRRRYSSLATVDECPSQCVGGVHSERPSDGTKLADMVVACTG